MKNFNADESIAYRGSSLPANLFSEGAYPVSGDRTSKTTPAFTLSLGDLWHAPRVFASEVAA